MNLREITIGRSGKCDIFLDSRCQYASSVHATIFCDGNQLMYRDNSTNGTVINNVRVHKRIVPIHRGDVIMVAGKYQIGWNQIDSFFPNVAYASNHQGTMIDHTSSASIQAAVVQNVTTQNTEESTPNLGKWSWGAFFLSGLWGLFNGCWWIFLVNIIIYLLGLIPVVTIFTGIGSLVFSIFCGMKGTAWAWENKSWKSVSDFERTQKNWDVAGIIVFCLSLLLLMICLFLFFFVLAQI